MKINENWNIENINTIVASFLQKDDNFKIQTNVFKLYDNESGVRLRSIY